MISGHSHTLSLSQNHKAQLASAYNELGKELASQKVKVVGNYTLGKVIGEGTYGTVRLGIHRLTGTRVAIKQVPKAVSPTLTREIHHHRQLHHPHVTQLYEVIATENHIWLVTELCSGGELFDYLVEKGRVSEAETRVIFGQLCLAVAYIHAKGILHRDLKLENVLLDERCRVKLGDFGFTREYEHGTLLDTFCGTTGYASPEMLQAKKYLGPEVDVWSLGIILYTLLTGTLPFDDDDDNVMRQKIIKGDYEDPEWLSDESRDLISKTLQTDPSQRLSISQMLSHSWFTAYRPISPLTLPPKPQTASPPTLIQKASSSTASDASFHSASSEYFPLPSVTTTPDEGSEKGRSAQDAHMILRNPSDGTIKKTAEARGRGGAPRSETLLGGEASTSSNGDPASRPMLPRTNSKEPPAYPMRTPVRTKRRSVSSALSDHEDTVIPTPDSPIVHQDFASLLNTPAPVIFSTPVERQLLNSLSSIGFDTGQIVHSVLSDACDATGSLWWMLKRRAEKIELEQAKSSEIAQDSTLGKKAKKKHDKSHYSSHHPSHRHETVGNSRDLELLSATENLTRSAPELAFIPATPTSVAPTTPPRPGHPLLSPAGSIDVNLKSFPSTPGSTTGSGSSKGRKARSGSVSIMQRATTALEAAGLVRKKSAEAVREDKDKERDKEKESEKDKGKDSEKRSGSGDESRMSHASGSSNRAKSPHSKVDPGVPSTPSADYDLDQSHLSSPWVMPKPSKHSAFQSTAPTPANSPPDTLTALPNIGRDGSKTGSAGRNRASLLSAFRMWFNEDRRGKRKQVPQPGRAYGQGAGAPPTGRSRGALQRRGSSGSKRTGGRHRARHSISSRRSSSVNSRRSSIASVVVLDTSYQAEPMVSMSRQRSDPSRKSFGAHTPNSERGEYGSRPSSVISVSVHRHRKSPSQSSASSMHARTASPVSKFHRREGSGSSTRVVRQMQAPRPRARVHGRSNSTASSICSLSSSRRNSFYEVSETEGQRTSSPLRAYSAHSFDDTPRRLAHSTTTFIAQKRQTPFTSPSTIGSLGRSSWKKAWGAEPPGWQSRSTHPTTIEVLAISPAVDAPANIRDVFSGRHSLSLSHGDESDWVDEDEDGMGYAGGLGQLPALATSSTWRPSPAPSPISPVSSSSSAFSPNTTESPMSLAVPPKSSSGRASAKKGRNNPVWSAGSGSAKSRGGKAGQSPVGRQSPLPVESFNDTPENRGTRRQLPSGRSNGPSFKASAIQEEDEGEEE